MRIVIDSVSVQHLLRSIKLSKQRLEGRELIVFETPLDAPLEEKKLSIALDEAGGLIDKWGRTCGEEHIKDLITKWEGFGAVKLVKPIRKIQTGISKQLRQLGFKDTIDKLILRIALATNDRTVVSEDPDFWDPANPQRRGDQNAPVAHLCYNHLGITIFLLGTLLQNI